MLTCVRWPQGGELKWNVTFYSVPDCICLYEWHRPSQNSLEASLAIDINFNQMCPQWAWLHEWVNAHCHTATKPQFEPLLNISLSLTLLPSSLRWQLNCEWNVTLPCYLHGDCNMCAWLCVCIYIKFFSSTQTDLHRPKLCAWTWLLFQQTWCLKSDGSYICVEFDMHSV